MQHRLSILLALAVLAAAGVAIARAGDEGGNGSSTKAETRNATTTVLGSTASSTVPVPPKPTTTATTTLPNPNQQPGQTPKPAGDLGNLSDAEQRRELEAFLATRPALVPFEDQIWYSAHYSYSNVTAKGLAGLVWCVGFRIESCNRANDAAHAAQR